MSSFYLLQTNNENKLWQKHGQFWELTKQIKTTISDNYNEIYVIKLYKGFRTDGLSVPKIFQWYLPSWDKNNPTYNLAGIIHDALYTIGWKDNRELCDDVFRGILRDSGISRFKAGMADKCLEMFAGGKEHWKNDNYKNIGKITIQ